MKRLFGDNFLFVTQKTRLLKKKINKQARINHYSESVRETKSSDEKLLFSFISPEGVTANEFYSKISHLYLGSFRLMFLIIRLNSQTFRGSVTLAFSLLNVIEIIVSSLPNI